MSQPAVVLLDPPWAYRNFSDKAHGSNKPHYRTMGLAELGELPLAQWAAPDSHEFLWFTWPKMDQAVNLTNVWGFKHCTVIPWVKVTPNTGEIKRGVGFWTMGCSEGLQIAKRGSPSRTPRSGQDKPIGLMIDGGPDPYSWDVIEQYQDAVMKHLEDARKDDPEHACRFCCERVSAVFYAERGKRHSEKPLEIHDYIERYCPGPYMELFATKERPGWGAYGRETGWEITPEGVVPFREALDQDTTVTYAQVSYSGPETPTPTPASPSPTISPALDF